MNKWTSLALLFPAALTLVVPAQESPRLSIQQSLGFEQQSGELTPTGWYASPSGTVFADGETVHSGKWAVRLERTATSQGTFSVITKSLPVDFLGGTVELRGYLRTKDVTGYAGLWLREDGDADMLKLENMEGQQVKGTHDWTEYSIQLPVEPRARTLYLGVLVEGAGTLWADDLQLLVDGKPIANAPRPETPLDTDHEFDTGSKIHIDALTPLQIDNLVTLGRVWGFLKYHHPAIVAGKRHWDYDFFRILPAILAAPDRAHANDALVQWIDSLSPVPPCKPCAQLALGDLNVKPDIDWIHHQENLGAPLSQRLETIYVSRPAKDQFYISLMPGVGNPNFDHELSYSSIALPDSGYQLLALFRWWNIMQYWAPYREVAGQDWPTVLAAFIPKVALAKDKDAYALAMMELIAKANDTHANLWGSLNLRPPIGKCALPVTVRFVDDQPVVAAISTDAKEPSAMQRGDLLESVDGAQVLSLIAAWTPFYADSNNAARQRDMAVHFTDGSCGPASVQVRRSGKVLSLAAVRVPRTATANYPNQDLPGDTFRLLSPDVAYLKLSTIKAADIPGYMEKAKNTKGLIVDIRNYPSDFMPFVLGSLLLESHTPFVTFTNPDLANPGAFRFITALAIDPAQPYYNGKVVILVDEVSQSQAEYTAMALRAAPNAIVVGSTTAGADGNVSSIPLPGALHTAISGIGVFYPDHRPTQRIGIVPDIVSKPTLAGINAGRDEVLETAIRQILGPSASGAEIERLARPSPPAISSKP
jgi:C-terminal processing protease CtpA/Prc